MGLFRATVKHTMVSNGERIEKGMTVDFASPNGSPMSSNGGQEVVDAFKRVYGVDLKKAHAVSSSYIEVVKINK